MHILQQLCNKHPDKFEMPWKTDPTLFSKYSVERFATLTSDGADIRPFDETCDNMHLDSYEGRYQLAYNTSAEWKSINDFNELEKQALLYHNKVLYELKKLIRQKRLKMIEEL